MSVDTVVFDIGGVLVHWDPVLAWKEELGADGARAFLARIGFDKLNLACDAGASFAVAASSIADPEDAERLAHYVARYSLTVPHKLAGTWEALYDLKARGVCCTTASLRALPAWTRSISPGPRPCAPR
jgi:2-haloacid dehalogenase